jgi:hypothetical protein
MVKEEDGKGDLDDVDDTDVLMTCWAACYVLRLLCLTSRNGPFWEGARGKTRDKKRCLAALFLNE